MHHLGSFVATATAAMAMAPLTSAANLLVSHFSGGVYSLTYGSNNLTISSSTTGCGGQPSWITYDSASTSLYCFDESGGYANSPGGVVSSYKIGSNAAATLSGTAKTSGGEVHGWLYGGSDGRSFLSTAN